MKKTCYLLSAILLLMVSSCMGKMEKQNQDATPIIAENIPDTARRSLPEIYSLYLKSDSGKYKEMALPLSSYVVLDLINKNPGYQPTDKLRDHLKKKELEAAKYQCYTIPSVDNRTAVMLVWLAKGESEYYVVVTANEKDIIDSSVISQSIENGIISYIIEDNFSIRSARRMWTYDKEEDIKYLEGKDAMQYQIMAGGAISELSRRSKSPASMSFKELIENVPFCKLPLGNPELASLDSLSYDPSQPNRFEWTTIKDEENNYYLNDYFSYGEFADTINSQYTLLDTYDTLIFSKRLPKTGKQELLLYYIERYKSSFPKQKYPQWLLLRVNDNATIEQVTVLAGADHKELDSDDHQLFFLDANSKLTLKTFVTYNQLPADKVDVNTLDVNYLYASETKTVGI